MRYSVAGNGFWSIRSNRPPCAKPERWVDESGRRCFERSENPGPLGTGHVEATCPASEPVLFDYDAVTKPRVFIARTPTPDPQQTSVCTLVEAVAEIGNRQWLWSIRSGVRTSWTGPRARSPQRWRDPVINGIETFPALDFARLSACAIERQ